MSDDPELVAMGQVFSAIKDLDAEAQLRVLDWVEVRLGLNRGVRQAADPVDPPQEQRVRKLAEKTQTREGTVNTVVQKLGANSCRTALLAAAAHLVFYQGKEKFSREELVATAKEARIWKSDYVNQLSLNITRMCDAGELVEKGKDVYDLSQKKLAELEPKLDAD